MLVVAMQAAVMRKLIRLIETAQLDEISRLPHYDTPVGKMPPRTPASERQAQAVQFYKEHGYAAINAPLRGHEPEWKASTWGEMMADYGFYIDSPEAMEHLDALMANAPRRRGVLKTYRGESNSDHAEKLAAMQVGDSFVDPGYLSTSMRPGTGFYAFSRRGFVGQRANNILSMYLIPASVKAISLDTTQDDEPSPEAEVLINRGSTYTLAEKRLIPNMNKRHEVKEVLLLIWKVL